MLFVMTTWEVLARFFPASLKWASYQEALGLLHSSARTRVPCLALLRQLLAGEVRGTWIPCPLDDFCPSGAASGALFPLAILESWEHCLWTWTSPALAVGLVRKLKFESSSSSFFFLQSVLPWSVCASHFLWAKVSEFIYLQYVPSVPLVMHTGCSVVLAWIWAVSRGAPFGEWGLAFDHDVWIAWEQEGLNRS